ncbi:GNAT family N-acetyltransferase [Palleronia sediminis]|nr:GNAT family N-acetyltransferase [Palleronia sediminis]
MRLARPDELDAIRAFLAERVDHAIIPLCNLRDHGLEGTGPRAMRAAVAEDAGRLTGFAGLTGAGVLMVAGTVDAPGLRAVFRGARLGGGMGPPDVMRPVLKQLAPEAPREHDGDEPGFEIALPDVPPEGIRLRPPGDMPSVLRDMRADFLIEAMDMGRDAARDRAAQDCKRYVAAGSHRLVELDGDIVAMTGFNAEWEGVAQIGGVFVRPEWRGRGIAARAIRAHLAERPDLRRAILYAASEAATRAYRALEPRPIGRMASVVLAEPIVL